MEKSTSLSPLKIKIEVKLAYMKINFQSLSINKRIEKLPDPQPGEIWQVSSKIIAPLIFSEREEVTLYPKSAREFIAGTGQLRYVLIVKEAEPISDLEPEWQTISVMMLSTQTDFVSNVDLLLPSAITKLERDLIAETWQVQPMLSCNLLRAVGQRISRNTYDILLSIGDYYHNLNSKYPELTEIEAAGLKAGNLSYQKSQQIKSFHQEEEQWSEILRVPVAACYTYFKTLNFTEDLLTESVQIEREILDIQSDLSNDTEPELLKNKNLTVNLSNWFENIIEPWWQLPELSFAMRNSNVSYPIQHESIQALIEQLSPQYPESQRRSAAKELARVSFESKTVKTVIEALTKLFATTKSDLTMWVAADSIWHLNPIDSTVGVRRIKKIDLDICQNKPLILECRLIQHHYEGKVGLLFRVYCQGKRTCLPPNLQLILLDESETVIHQAISRFSDLYVQLQFKGEAGDRFGIKIANQNISLTENFII